MEAAEHFESPPIPQSEMTAQEAEEVAETLGTLTRQSLERAAHLPGTVAERIHYGHTWTLMLLESALTMGMARVEGMSFENLSLAGTSLLVLTATKAGAELYERVKGEKIQIGSYGELHVEPYRAVRSRTLSDGTIMKPGDKVGIMDFAHGILSKAEEESLFSYTKKLIRSAELSFIELAQLCEVDDPRLAGVSVFGGRSHLAGPVAKRMGFDVFDIANPLHSHFETWRGKKRVQRQVSYYKKPDDTGSIEAVVDQKWKEMEKNFKDPRDAYISRQKLLELYGSQSDRLQLLNARRSGNAVSTVGEAHEDDSLSVPV